MIGEMGSPLRPAANLWVAAVHPSERGRAPLGSGFLVDAQRVLTCAHVACPAWVRHGQLWVALPKAEALIGRRILVREVIAPPSDQQDIQDAAVLVLEEAVPEEFAARLRRPEAEDLVESRWWSFGFPDGMLGNSADGSVGEALGYGWVRLDTKSRYPVKSGYSGAAVWSADYQAVVGMVGHARDDTGDARALTIRAIDRFLPQQKLNLLSDWSVAAAGESALAAWGWTLAADPEAGRHWRPRARGVSTDAERGFRFCGRTAALHAIVAWITGTPERRALVVTGSPGVGKSAVLGRIVTTADPAIVAMLPPEDEALRAPPRSVSCAVHAKGKTALEVAREIAAAASAALPDQVGDLAPVLRTALTDRPGRGFTVVIDALDEATSLEQARTIVHRVVRRLVETCTDLDVRVVVGTRRKDDGGDLLAAFGSSAHVVDLDAAEFFSQADLVAYARASLQLLGDERPDNPYADPQVATPVAEQIATMAQGNFLVAGLIARTHGMQDRRPITPDRLAFPSTVDAALADYLALLPAVDGVPATDVLTALAYAEAPGLPIALWRTVIAALTGTTPGEHRLRTFARSSAANFLVETSTAEAPARVFRLFHQALDDTLLTARTQIAQPVDDEQAIAEALIDQGRSGGWRNAPEYLLRSLPRHAARGGVIDRLLTDAAYLLYADLRRLVPAASKASSPLARERARLLRKTPRALNATPANRTALFSVTEALEHLGSTYCKGNFSAPYQAVWAVGPPRDEEAVLEGHIGAVGAVCAVLTDGRTFLASGGDDGTVRLWDPATGEQNRVFNGHTGLVFGVCAVPVHGRTLLASGGDDGTVRLWDPATGEQNRVFNGHTGLVFGVCAVPVHGRTLLASGGDDGTVRLWDPAAGQQLRTLKSRTGPAGEHHPVRGLCAVPVDGRTLVASGGDDGTVRLWDPTTGKQLHTLQGRGDPHYGKAHCYSHMPRSRSPGGQPQTMTGHTGPVYTVCAVPMADRTLLASGGDDGTVRLWDPTTGQQLHTLKNHGLVFGVCAVPVHGRTLLASGGGNDHTVRLWDPATGQQLRTLVGHTGPIWGGLCALPQDGRTLLASGGGKFDGTVRLWDPATGEQTRDGRNFRESIDTLCAVPVGERAVLATGSTNGAVHLWDPVAGKPTDLLEGKGTDLSSHWVSGVCAVRVGGRTLVAIGSHNGTVRLRDPATGEEVRVIGHSWDLTFDTSGEELRIKEQRLIGDYCFTADGELISENYSAVCPVLMSGRTLLATSGEGHLSRNTTVRLWDPATGEHLRIVVCHNRSITAMCAIPVGGRTLLAGAGHDNLVWLWDPATGEQTHVLTGHTGWVNAVCAVSAGGRTLLASGSHDESVRLWDLATGEQTHVLTGHTDWVYAVCAVSVGGRAFLASGSKDRTVRLWSMESLRPATTVPIRYPVRALAAANDLIFVASHGGLLTLTVKPDMSDREYPAV